MHPSQIPWVRAVVAALAASWLVATLGACAPSAADFGGSALAAAAPADTARRAPRASSPPASTLYMPVLGVRVDDVVSNFGAPRGGRLHEGLDIFAAKGTPVYSAGAGIVRFAGSTPRGGWTVWIEQRGMDVWYTHLEAVAPALRVGARVTPDTLLGYVGNTGNARGGPTHLHFEIATSAGPIDPLPLLVDRF